MVGGFILTAGRRVLQALSLTWAVQSCVTNFVTKLSGRTVLKIFKEFFQVSVSLNVQCVYPVPVSY